MTTIIKGFTDNQSNMYLTNKARKNIKDEASKIVTVSAPISSDKLAETRKARAELITKAKVVVSDATHKGTVLVPLKDGSLFVNISVQVHAMVDSQDTPTPRTVTALAIDGNSTVRASVSYTPGTLETYNEDISKAIAVLLIQGKDAKEFLYKEGSVRPTEGQVVVAKPSKEMSKLEARLQEAEKLLARVEDLTGDCDSDISFSRDASDFLAKPSLIRPNEPIIAKLLQSVRGNYGFYTSAGEYVHESEVLAILDDTDVDYVQEVN